ncbi:MAG: hypothetical protein JWO44_2391 [Bacteroidetes bacterium]|nr:hypothetical protein [Bacteroidota bacterium]
MKRILVAVALFVSIGAANAQEPAQQPEKKRDSRDRLHFGLKAGINNSNVYNERGEQFKAEPKYGFAGGAFFSVPVGKYLGVQPAALISQKGFHATGTLTGNPYDLSRTTTYLDVPLMIEFKPLTVLTIVGGPQYSYLFNQTDILKGGDNTAIQEQEFRNDNIRKNILSAAVGLDINISRFVFSGRYNFDLQQNNGDGTSNTPTYKNVWLQGTVGIRF